MESVVKTSDANYLAIFNKCSNLGSDCLLLDIVLATLLHDNCFAIISQTVNALSVKPNTKNVTFSTSANQEEILANTVSKVYDSKWSYFCQWLLVRLNKIG